MSPQTPYVRALRAELVSAVATQRDRQAVRQRRATLVAAAAAVFVLVVGAVSAFDATSTPALAISSRGDHVTVTLVDAAADPSAMTRQLAEAGIDAVVVAQPVPAALAGRWVGGTGRVLDWRPDAVTLPRDVRGLVLRVGVASPRSSLIGASAFADGGLLACTGLAGAEVTQVTAALARRDLPHTWRDLDGQRLTAPPTGDVLVDATLDSSGALVLVAGPAGTPNAEEPSCG